MISDCVEKFQGELGYRFKDVRLLENALTHSSFANERGLPKTEANERLEFLGDAVLELVVSEHIFKENRDMPEGEMTKLRASIVCEESLSYHARKLDLGEYLLLGKGERASGGANRASLLADAFEAVLGAIFLDGGIEKAREYALGILIRNSHGKTGKIDYKTNLQELIQRDSKEPLVYRVISETGPDHDKKFVSVVAHEGRTIGRGEGRSKKESEQQAACAALEALGRV